MLRKINVFGLPMTTGPKDELIAEAGSSPDNIHVVVRVVDVIEELVPQTLRARRHRTPCEDCREICWYDPESIIDPQAAMLCLQCTNARLKRLKETS